MKLASYLREHKIRRSAFARDIGVAASYVTALCNDDCWPGREVITRIHAVTNGDVTANDFLDTSTTPTPTSEAAE